MLSPTRSGLSNATALKELLIRYNLFPLQCNCFERALGQLMIEANIASPVASMDAAVMMNQGFR